MDFYIFNRTKIVPQNMTHAIHFNIWYIHVFCRDYGKKVHGFEIELDETTDKLNKATETYEEKDKLHKEVESDIAALTRRIMLMEEEAKKSETTLANTVTKLALTSKSADEVLKKVKQILMRSNFYVFLKIFQKRYFLDRKCLTPIAGQSCGEQVLKQRGDFGGVGQEPETDDKDGFRQRAEAG